MQPASPFAGTSQLSVAPPLTSAPSASSAGLLQLGPVHLFPHLRYSVSYGNSLQSSPGQRANSLINEVAPGIFLRLGDHWSLDYTPALRFYSNRELKDAVDHVVNLTGSTSYADWLLAFSQGYAATSQPLIETASELAQEVYSTSLTASHPLGSKLSIDLGLYQNFRYVDANQQSAFNQNYTDTREWSTMDWLNYKFTPEISVGLGIGASYDNLAVGSDMTGEQVQGRLAWNATKRITLAISGGADYRQFLDSNVPNLLSPIFSASIQYHLFENTTLSLAANRSIQPSFFENSVSETTGVSVGLQQRLLKHLTFEASGGYTSTTYNQTANVPASANANDYESTSVSIRLATVVLRRLSASVFFQENFITSNSSTATAGLFNYNTRQYGLALGYHF
jgi:hypothetical protein